MHTYKVLYDASFEGAVSTRFTSVRMEKFNMYANLEAEQLHFRF